jgi:hypothetical protein
MIAKRSGWDDDLTRDSTLKRLPIGRPRESTPLFDIVIALVRVSAFDKDLGVVDTLNLSAFLTSTKLD